MMAVHFTMQRTSTVIPPKIPSPARLLPHLQKKLALIRSTATATARAFFSRPASLCEGRLHCDLDLDFIHSHTGDDFFLPFCRFAQLDESEIGEYGEVAVDILRGCLKRGWQVSLRGGADDEAISFSGKDCFAALAMT